MKIFFQNHGRSLSADRRLLSLFLDRMEEDMYHSELDESQLDEILARLTALEERQTRWITEHNINNSVKELDATKAKKENNLFPPSLELDEEDLSDAQLDELLSKVTTLLDKQERWLSTQHKNISRLQASSNSTTPMRIEVPRFSGDNPSAWISSTQRYFDFYNISEQRRLVIAPLYLDGIAIDWYEWMQKYQLISCWKGFLAAIEKRFCHSACSLGADPFDKGNVVSTGIELVSNREIFLGSNVTLVPTAQRLEFENLPGPEYFEQQIEEHVQKFDKDDIILDHAMIESTAIYVAGVEQSASCCDKIHWFGKVDSIDKEQMEGSKLPELGLKFNKDMFFVEVKSLGDDIMEQQDFSYGIEVVSQHRNPGREGASGDLQGIEYANKFSNQLERYKRVSKCQSLQSVGQLIVFHDNNRISIVGDTEITLSDKTHFKWLGWHMIWVKNGNTGCGEIFVVMKEAKTVEDKSTLLKVTTTICYGFPNKANSYSVHGSALVGEKVEVTRKYLSTVVMIKKQKKGGPLKYWFSGSGCRWKKILAQSYRLRSTLLVLHLEDKVSFEQVGNDMMMINAEGPQWMEACVREMLNVLIRKIFPGIKTEKKR